MNDRLRVLIICQHNSGRSQMAAAYLKRFAGEFLVVESAGMKPADRVDPLVVEVMQEDGVDLSGCKPQSVFELFKAGRLYDHVITVCHEAESHCPIYPGMGKRWHMPFADPSKAIGSLEEKRQQIREIRDKIKAWLLLPGEGVFSFNELMKK